MRNRWACVGWMLTASLPALGARQMTVEQLAQAVKAAHEAHRADDAAMRELADVTLTARLDNAALSRMLAESPGPRTAQALRALADASVFLEPPASEIPATPAPDVATQKAMLAKAVHYVARTMPGLPNFLAVRETAHFDDSPQELTKGEWPVRAGLHLMATTTTPISFRDGRETDDPTLLASNAMAKGDLRPVGAADAQKTWAPAIGSGVAAAIAPTRAVSQGMTSWGEFGPILGIVLVDVAKGKLSWSHWETMEGRQVAVYQFSVDRSVSHYTVEYCCTRFAEVIGSHYGGSSTERRGGGGDNASAGQDNSSSGRLIHQVSGYHGFLTVDPETGTILRITLSLDLKLDDPIQRGAMMVEYGPMEIGGSTFICPTRSVTLSAAPRAYDNAAGSPIKDVPLLQLNDVVFSGYRRFGSEATLVADVGQEANAVSGPPVGGQPIGLPDQVGVPPIAPAAVAEAAPAPAPAPAPAVSVAATNSAVEEQEMLVAETKEMPFSGGSASQSGGEFTLKTTTRLVDVSLLAFDKRGKPITDLKLEDVEIYDNGKKQQVHAFRHANPAAAPAPAAPAPAPTEPEDTFTNETPVTVAVQDVPDLLILLMDESHLAFQDLTRAKDEVLRFLRATRPTSRVALYSIGEHGFHVIQDVTQDHELVISKLSKWMPSAASVAQAQELDRRTRQQFDTVHSAQDLNSVNGNYTEVPDTMQTTDPELRQMGDNPLRQALEGMTALARHFGSVPGHKSLAWISGDSALGDWEDQAVGMEKGSKYLEAAIVHTREALNEAHIALYAVDASAVEGGQIDAALENRNVQLNQAAADNASLNGPGPARNSAGGRVQAAMEQDLHGIQGPVRQLAEATGGRAIRKGSDLAATLGTIEQDSQALYEVGFEPNTAADGKFHTLELKIPGHKDAKLRYRTGYVYTEEQAGNRERFQQTVWSPQDAAGIGLTAEAVPAVDKDTPARVKLRIAFKDVGLQQKPDVKTGQPRWTDNLFIFVAQRNDATQKAEVSGDTLRLSLKQGTYDSGMPAGIPYQRSVEVKSRLGTVRVIVVDGSTGRMGSVTLPASALMP